jgi:4-hydroxy-L-threonine phosphate dehydrogenase PdxA
MVSFSTNIHAPLDQVWEHFLYKIEHPEHFVPGVSNVEIIEKTGDYVLRAMELTTPDGAQARVVEKIIHAPYTVKFLIVDHPKFSGHVDNLAEKISENETKITFSMYWVNKETGEPFSNQELVKSAVLKTVSFMLQSS